MVVELGGGLRAYEDERGPLLDGFDSDQPCTSGRGQHLLPWPNRICDGRYEFDGQQQQLSLSEPANRNAIHGLVRWANWALAARAPDRVVLEHVLHEQPGWPGVLALRLEYALDAVGLSVTTTAVNVGARAIPFGAGSHPYLTLGAPMIDSLTLQAPGRAYFESDPRGIPTSRHSVTGTPFDFTRPRQLGDSRLDTAFTDLIRDDDGLARVRLWTEGRAATLWMDASYGYLMLFTGETLPPSERRRGLAVEPMTCAPNAFVSGEGVRRLEPGEEHRASWGITPG